ncbi:MAG: hypothetical protein LKG15_05055 [Corynebacterium provencense]|uniref:hypothetical protein n=1 Tax=Corynebacterium provencense TaxID=1737425 RepID=UPI002989E405|nr:hypothetical protein [Corynebacterium provencense]
MARRRVPVVPVVVGAAAGMLLLINNYGYQGILLSVTLGAFLAFLLFRRDSERELESLRNSIGHSATDISRILGQWHDFHLSRAPEHVRDRVLHRPCLLDRDCGVESVQRFHDAVKSAEEFLHGLPARVQQATSVSSLTAVLREADHQADRLAALWSRARKDTGIADVG